MPDEIPSPILTQIQSISRKIAVANNLDDEIQRELCDHMTDKLLAYKSGAEPLTDADAMLLVKHHFGDPRTIRSLFRRVHQAEAFAALARRLAAVAVATLFWMIFVSVIYAAITKFFTVRSLTVQASTTWLITLMVIALTNIGGLWATLLFWKRRIARGQKLWFQRLGPAPLALIVILAIAAWMALPVLFGPPTAPAGIGQYAAHWAITGVGLLGFSGGFLKALAWTWWIGLSPRRPRELLAAALAWSTFSILTANLGLTWWPTNPMKFDGTWQLTWLPTQMGRYAWTAAAESALIATGTVLALAIVIHYGEQLRKRFSRASLT